MRDTAIQGLSRSSAVMPIDAAYMTSLLALDSNLISILNRSWDITPSLYSLSSNLNPVYNLLPLNSLTDYLFIIISV